jgi:hypothetical protein
MINKLSKGGMFGYNYFMGNSNKDVEFNTFIKSEFKELSLNNITMNDEANELIHDSIKKLFGKLISKINTHNADKSLSLNVKELTVKAFKEICVSFFDNKYYHEVSKWITFTQFSQAERNAHVLIENLTIFLRKELKKKTEKKDIVLERFSFLIIYILKDIIKNSILKAADLNKNVIDFEIVFDLIKKEDSMLRSLVVKNRLNSSISKYKDVINATKKYNS